MKFTPRDCNMQAIKGNVPVIQEGAVILAILSTGILLYPL